MVVARGKRQSQGAYLPTRLDTFCVHHQHHIQWSLSIAAASIVYDLVMLKCPFRVSFLLFQCMCPTPRTNKKL